MAELKTKVNDSSVIDFINSTPDEQQREDAWVICNMLQDLTGEQPKMWGSSMVGFGQYHYKSERSSQEGDWLRIGFSPRKANLTVYLMGMYAPESQAASQKLLERLGKHTTGKGCLYIKKLADVDRGVLKELMVHTLDYMNKTYPNE